MENGRCRLHGGKSLRGIASPRWKDGRYSKYLPTNLQAKYQEALTDRELLALIDEIALLRTRQFQLLKRVDTSEAREHWDNIEGYVNRLIKAVQVGDKDGATVSLQNLRDAVASAKADYALWGEIVDMVERIRKLSETEAKRRKDMQLMIQAEDAMNLVTAMAILAREYVPKDKLQKYSDELTRMLRGKVTVKE